MRDYWPIYSRDRKCWCIFTRKPDSLWLEFFYAATDHDEAQEVSDLMNAGLPA